MQTSAWSHFSSWALCLSRRFHALWAVLLTLPQQPRCLSPRQPIWLIRKSIFRSILNGWNAYSCALLHQVAFVHKHVDIRGGVALLSVGVGEVLAVGQRANCVPMASNNEVRTESLPHQICKKRQPPACSLNYNQHIQGQQLLILEVWPLRLTNLPPPSTRGITSRLKNLVGVTSDAKHLTYKGLFLFVSGGFWAVQRCTDSCVVVKYRAATKWRGDVVETRWRL